MTDGGVRIVGFAGCTSLGYSIEPTLAAMGAGLSNFTDTVVLNGFGLPVAAGSLFEPEMPRAARLVALSEIALVDVALLLAEAGVERAPFMVSIASNLEPDETAALARVFETNPLVHPNTAWVPLGRAGALVALQRAVDLVGRGAHRFIVVGGIDSLCAPAVLRTLVQSERVLAPHVEGTIPGEGAVFALVSRADDSVELPTSVLVEACAQMQGASFLQLDRVNADTLTAMFRSLREQGAAQVDWIVAAHSGEGYFGRSFSHAYLREVEIMPEPLEVEHTADRAGDVGAAAGLLGAACAMYRMATRFGKAPRRVLVYSESDTGEIGAVILQGAPKSWQRRRESRPQVRSGR